MITAIIAHLWSLGGSVAIVQSYTDHKSVGWAAIHGLFGWAYPLYRWITD